MNFEKIIPVDLLPLFLMRNNRAKRCGSAGLANNGTSWSRFADLMFLPFHFSAILWL